MIPDRFFYPVVALLVAALIALAMVYPQGQGARSPKPFGHEPPPPGPMNPGAPLPATVAK
jgi:hypothetical protein